MRNTTLRQSFRANGYDSEALWAYHKDRALIEAARQRMAAGGEAFPGIEVADARKIAGEEAMEQVQG